MVTCVNTSKLFARNINSNELGIESAQNRSQPAEDYHSNEENPHTYIILFLFAGKFIFHQNFTIKLPDYFKR